MYPPNDGATAKEKPEARVPARRHLLRFHEQHLHNRQADSDARRTATVRPLAATSRA